MNIGKTMRRIRKEAGTKQVTLAREIGISPQALRALESGHSVPKQATIDKFCQALNVSMAQLVLESLSYEDMPDDVATADDVLDILALALLRIKRSRTRKPLFSASELEEQSRKLQNFKVNE